MRTRAPICLTVIEESVVEESILKSPVRVKIESQTSADSSPVPDEWTAVSAKGLNNQLETIISQITTDMKLLVELLEEFQWKHQLYEID